MAQFELHDRGELRRLVKDLRQASNGKALRKEFTAQVRGALRPIVPEVRAAYRASPSMGHDSMSRGSRSRIALRILLARATRVEVRLTGRRAGVRIRVDGRKMPERMKALPQYWEGEKPRWRHPVFGRRTAWAQQRPRRTFYPIVERHESRVVAAVDQAADEVGRKIERGTA